MKIDFRKALIAGVVGTLALDLTGLLLTGSWWDIPDLLAAKLAMPLPLGVLLHYTLGVTLTVLYAAVVPSLPGGRWTRPILYVTAETVLGVYLFMLPLLGAGAFGLGLGVAVPFISLARHLAYGGVLGWLFPVEGAVVSSSVSRPHLHGSLPGHG